MKKENSALEVAVVVILIAGVFHGIIRGFQFLFLSPLPNSQKQTWQEGDNHAPVPTPTPPDYFVIDSNKIEESKPSNDITKPVDLSQISPSSAPA